MNTILQTAKAALQVMLNKAFSIIILIALMFAYASIPPVRYDEFGNKTGGMPFADLLFVAVLIAAVFSVTPIVRILFFPEASIYAESGQLKKDLQRNDMTFSYRHYRLATVISFAVTLLIFATLGQ